MEEKKLALTSAIDTLEKQICNLQQELLAKQRELWWLTRPYIKSFSNDWEYEGGKYAIWSPTEVEWLICDVSNKIVSEFFEDPYPGFENAPDVVVNPNCT